MSSFDEPSLFPETMTLKSFLGEIRTLGVPVEGFSRLYLGEKTTTLLRIRTAHYITSRHLISKEILRFAAIIARIKDTLRNKNPKSKYCVEPIGYREIVRLLNADPAQKKKVLRH
jgi:hypothetical protein